MDADQIDRLMKILSPEEKENFLYFENAAKDEAIIQAAKDIFEHDYLGPIMAACRRRAGKTQKEMAEMLGCRLIRIARLETGITILNKDFALKWFQAINAKDALTALMYGNVGIIAMVNKLKKDGYWK